MLRRIAMLLAGLAVIALTVVFGMNRFSLTVIPEGEEHILLEYGEDYADPGVQLCFRGTLFCREGIAPKNAAVTVAGAVEEDTLGQYTLRYRGEYLWFRSEAERNVSVIDTQSPVITLIEDPEEIPLPYQEAGFYAWDNHDGDITDKVIRREYMGKITYAVTDSSGNPAYAERSVPFHDPVPPEILLEGGAEYTVPTGIPYREAGFRAIDNVDGELTDLVTVEGTVDWLRPGIYPVSYNVTDSYGNTTQIIRRVEVAAAQRPQTHWPDGKTIYLTFDDGPGPYTERLLDILDAYGVKATFFVVNSEHAHLMKEITDRGHSIGIHSVTHDYEAVYASAEAYFEDLFAMQQIIYENTGVMTHLMRFPGGSSNMVSRNTCRGIMTFLTEAVQNAGFRYFDWNVDADDAGKAYRKKTVLDNVVKGIAETDVALVLQHDVYDYSVDAVADIIRWGLDNGYTFETLEFSSPNFPHPLNN